jgi:hypothetical protein
MYAGVEYLEAADADTAIAMAEERLEVYVGVELWDGFVRVHEAQNLVPEQQEDAA